MPLVRAVEGESSRLRSETECTKDGRGSGLCKNENYANHAGSQVKWKLLESDEGKAKPKAMISFTVESSWFINIHIDFSKTYYSDIPHIIT